MSQKNALVVYCHPYEKSLNHAVLDAVRAAFEAQGKPCEVVDLEADGFDPVIHAPELALYGEGGHTDPLVQRSMDALDAADRLVLVTPIWWNDIPALLKGWFDKVMLVGFSWESTGHGLKGTLGSRIGRVDVFSTSAEPTEHIQAAVSATLMDGTLAQLGIPERRWHNFGQIEASTPDSRAAWLDGVAAKLV